MRNSHLSRGYYAWSLGKRLKEMLDLFTRWDEDGNGLIDKREFRAAVAALGLQYEEAIVDAVFDCYDADGSGSMSYTEFVQYSLRDSLKRSATRVMTLFRQWDNDQSGSVDKKEFREAVRALGFDAPNEAIDSVFDSMDIDHGGSVDFKELNKMLRQGASIHLAKDLQAGAAGKIEVGAKNARGLRNTPTRRAASPRGPPPRSNRNPNGPLANKPDWQGPLRSGDRDHSTPIPRNSRHARRHESHLV